MTTTLERTDLVTSSVMLRPWDGIGATIPENVSRAKQLVAAGLHWDAERRPIFDANGKQIFEGVGKKKLQPVFQIARTDNGQHLGFGSERLQIVNNSELWDYADGMVGRDAVLETAGLLGGGKRVWMQFRINSGLEIAGDEIGQYLLMTNCHNGKGSILAIVTPLRFVCMNMLNAVTNKAKRMLNGVPQLFRIRHTGDMDAKFAEAGRVLGLTHEYYDAFAEFAEGLLAKPFSTAQYEEFVTQKLVPMPKKPSARGETLIKNTWEKYFTALKVDNLQNVQGTAWAAYNAIADVADHERVLKNVNTRAAQEQGFTRTWENTTIKDDAVAFLLAA